MRLAPEPLIYEPPQLKAGRPAALAEEGFIGAVGKLARLIVYIAILLLFVVVVGLGLAFFLKRYVIN